jgi:hypothetical protein
LALVVLYGAGTNLSGRVGAGWRIDLIVRLFSSPSADRLAVADRACRTALAEIDGEARTTILFALNIADVDGLRRHSPEAKEDGRARECGGRGRRYLVLIPPGGGNCRSEKRKRSSVDVC